MPGKYTERTVEYDAYGRVNPTSGSITYSEPDFIPKGKHTWSEWEACRICGFLYPKSELVYVKGAPYCTRFQHYLDVPGTSAGQYGR